MKRYGRRTYFYSKTYADIIYTDAIDDPNGAKQTAERLSKEASRIVDLVEGKRMADQVLEYKQIIRAAQFDLCHYPAEESP